jgi:serine/threonine protein kinase
MSSAFEIGPAERFLLLWQEGNAPAIEEFATATGVADARGLAALVRVDQVGRWGAGQPTAVEEYLRRYPPVAADQDTAIELIINEFALSASRGQAADPEDFIRRFPAHAVVLARELNWYRTAGARRSAETVLSLPSTTRLGTEEAVSPPTDELPNPFGRYQIRELLGRGGMAAVYAAYDPHLDRRVALKVPVFAPGDPEAIERFFREARIAAHFHDPHLCPVYEAGEIGGTYYLAMPVIEGPTLADRLKTGPLAQTEAARVAASVARAMAVAHAAGIVHRDLKPKNIVLSASGPVITDFGLARRMGAAEPDRCDGRDTAGTPAYMAPEQVTGDVEAIGPATDVYALGVVLYEMLTGVRPFDGPLGSILEQIIGAEPDPPGHRQPGIDEQVATICCTALAKRREDRHVSMTAFADALDDFLPDAETTARRRRGPAIRTLALGALAFGATVGAAVWHSWHTAPRPELVEPGPDTEAALAWAELAWRLNNDGDLDRAIDESTGALRLDDRCISALLCRANSWLKKKETRPAIEDLRRVLAIDPARHEAMVDLAWAHNELGEYKQAMDVAGKAVALVPDSAEAHNQAGWAQLKQGLYREAILDFTVAIRYDPRYALAYHNRACAYKEVGEGSLAADDDSRANKLALAASREGGPPATGEPER